MKVWDLPLRLFHWSFMVCVFGAIISGKMAQFDVHERFGLAILGLVTFRIIWGFIGSHTARFSHFIKGPSAFISAFKTMLKGQTSSEAGHSAVGGYATLALLAIPLAMALTGGFSTDDILFDGPFYHWQPDWAKQAGTLHHLGEKFLFLIILLHLAALAYYFFRIKKNLIPPMVTGKSASATGTPASLSAGKTIFGIVLLLSLVALAQSATYWRPDYF